MIEMRTANALDLEKLIQIKIDTIISSDPNITKSERIKIETYVKKETKRHLDEYKIIIVDGCEVGTLLVYEYKDGIIIDELYLDPLVRNKGVGSKILKEIIGNNKKNYLWVYKSNTKAIKLYKKFKFIVLEETESRYLMLNDKRAEEE